MTQVEYIAVLFGDCGIDTAVKRRAWLDLRGYGADIDALSTHDRTSIIRELLDRKKELRDARLRSNNDD